MISELQAAIEEIQKYAKKYLDEYLDAVRDELQAALARAEEVERQRDEAWTAGAEAMREAIYNYVYDEAEAMKEQAYNLIEHHSFRPGGRGVSNEAKRKGFIRDRQQIAEKLFIDAAHIRTLPIPAQEGK